MRTNLLVFGFMALVFLAFPQVAKAQTIIPSPEPAPKCDCGDPDTYSISACSSKCGFKITPKYYSAEKSIGDANEYLEGAVHSGTRDTAAINDPSNPNNYGPVIALMPKGIDEEKRVEFVKSYGDYEVSLADGSKKKAIDIWNACTNKGDLNQWQNYLTQLDACPDWGYVPLTYREIAPSGPVVKTKEDYFEDPESPLVAAWSPLQMLVNWFRDTLCNLGWLGSWICRTQNLSLKNPDNTGDWTAGKPNIPLETKSNAATLRQLLVPAGIELGNAPTGNDSYFNTNDTNTAKVLSQIGEAAQQTSAEGGLFRIFTPMSVPPTPAICNDKVANPDGGCASDFYYEVQDKGDNKGTFYSDTPDNPTEASQRPIDDRPVFIRTYMNFFQQSLFPKF